MSKSERSNPLEYATPGTAARDKRAGLGVARRIVLGVGLGLLCFGAGWGLTPRPPHQIETAWMMGIGGLIVGIASPSIRR